MIEELSEQQVRERLTRALRRLAQLDKHLFAVDPNERSLTHRLGVYLEQLFPGWHVDCEYNRRGDAKKQIREYPTETTTDDNQRGEGAQWFAFYGICPQGHRIDELKIGEPEARCPECGRDYMIQDEAHI